MNRSRADVKSAKAWGFMATVYLLSSCLGWPVASAAAAKPNIILILADDLGYGDLGCYGQSAIQTPNLDRLAQDGMRFTDFYAGSTVCAPSRCVLMTGLHTGHCFIRGNGRVDLRPEDVTVAEVLKGAGYATAIFGKWGLGHEGSLGVPTRQGFDRFFGFLDQAHAHNYYPSFLIDDERRLPLRNIVPEEGSRGQGQASEKLDYAPDLIFERAMQWLRGVDGSKPFFLYLPYTIPHANNEAGREGMEVPELSIYADRDWPEPQKGHAAMITRMDAEIGRLLELLEELGRAQDTLVLFTSDNGPHREGGNDPGFHDSNGPLRGIKRSLHDGGIRVPLIARWPGHVAAGSVSDRVGSFADLLPTAAELAGVDAGEGLDGLSLLSTLTGREAPGPDHLYWEFYEGQGAQAVRFGRWKAIRKPMFSGQIQLYDLARDLGEEHDLAADNPDEVQRARELMESEHVPSPLWKVRR